MFHVPQGQSGNVTVTFWQHFHSRPPALGWRKIAYWIISRGNACHLEECLSEDFLDFPLLFESLFLFLRRKWYLWLPSPPLLTTSVNHCVEDSERTEGNHTLALSMSHVKLSLCLIKSGNAWNNTAWHPSKPHCGCTHWWLKVNGRMRVRCEGQECEEVDFKHVECVFLIVL